MRTQPDARWTTSSSVASATTTSTSRLAGTGLKKCRPMTRAGRSRTAASCPIDRLLVLLANTASSATTVSMLAKTRVLRSRSSGTASTTKPQPTSDCGAFEISRRPRTSSTDPVSVPRSALRRTASRTRSRASEAASGSASTSTTSLPASSRACAIPAPIRPPPTTPVRCGSALVVWSSSMRSPRRQLTLTASTTRFHRSRKSDRSSTSGRRITLRTPRSLKRRNLSMHSCSVPTTPIRSAR